MDPKGFHESPDSFAGALRVRLQLACGRKSSRRSRGDTGKEVGDPDLLKVFANAAAADTWLEENEPEGVAFEYEVLE
jgi:hypothetical protein